MTSTGANSESKERTLWDDFHSARRPYARDELLQLYEPLARSLAARMYAGRIDDSVTFADYLQYGRVGLIEAVDRYDETRGVAFSAYAMSRIRGAILNGLARESESAAQNRFWRAQARDRIDSLVTAVAPSADRASLAQIATITMGLAVGILLEESSEEFEPADQNPHNNPYAANELTQLGAAIRKFIRDLPDRERTIIAGHYFERIEFQRLAEQLSVTKGRVAQLHAQALLRLRTWMEERPALDRKI